MKVIAINGHRHQDTHLAYIGQLLSAFLRGGYRIAISEAFYDYLAHHGLSRIGECARVRNSDDIGSPEVVISLGGDGTVLDTARWVRDKAYPILGINTGRLGYLASVSAEDAETLVSALESGEFRREERELIKAEGECLPDDIWPYALNEVAVLRNESPAMLQTSIYVDHIFLGEYQADGVIVSTPTGSTGYNLSVGGPILQPGIPCRVISPVAPHTLTLRPVVVHGDSLIELTSTCRGGKYSISLDGKSFPAPAGSKICLRKADFKIVLLRRRQEGFADVLRNKLLWATPGYI